jgi:hypothetical protein
MPFPHEDTSAFEPDDLAILNDVFDLAWQRLLADGLHGHGDEDDRRSLAKCIMAHAKPGNLDVTFLLDHCVVQFKEAKQFGPRVDQRKPRPGRGGVFKRVTLVPHAAMLNYAW